MKKVLSLASALLFSGAAGIALSQTGAPAPSLATLPNPNAPPMRAVVKVKQPRLDKIRARVDSQNKRVLAGVKSRKLTGDQAKAFHVKIMSIVWEMQKDLKTGSTRELTGNQFKELNQLLDKNAKALQDELAPATSTAPAAK
jgi:hypothetical protein